MSLAFLSAACTWETGVPDDLPAIQVDRSLLVTEGLPAISLDEALRGATQERWTSADYRLLAVVNRTDLSVMPDRAAEGGEGRLVFGHLRADRTVIVEYAQPGPAKAWASRWCSLDRGPTAIAALIADFGPIAQVRSADATNGEVTLRQFAVEGGALCEVPLRNEPDLSRVSRAELESHARSNADALAQGTSLMPPDWWATSAIVARPPASMPKEIANETCTGCHAKTATGFQIEPRTGKPTGFLSNADAPSDELRRRVLWMQRTLRQ